MNRGHLHPRAILSDLGRCATMKVLTTAQLPFLFAAASTWFASDCIRAQIAFANPLPLGPNIADVQQIHVHDLDGDGTNEIILGSSWIGSVIAAKFTGGSVEAYDRLLPNTVWSSVMTVVDMNNDGLLDILRGDVNERYVNGDHGLVVHTGLGGSAFSGPDTIVWGINYSKAWAADLTGDGLAEVVARGANLDVYSRTQLDTAYALIGSFSIGALDDLYMVDVSGDGVDDLVYTSSNLGTHAIKVWIPTTGATTPQQLGTYWSYQKLLAEDLDGDGDVDLLAEDFNNGAGQTFSLWSNSGEGTFTRTSDIPLGPTMFDYIAIHRFQGETIPRIIHKRQGYLHARTILPGPSAGAEDTLAVGLYEREILFTDLDANGTEDLVVLELEDRLNWASGPLLNGTPLAPSELFAWPHRSTTALTALDEPNGGQCVAFISGGTGYDNDVFLVDAAAGDIPLLRAGLQNATWVSHGSGLLHGADLDEDGDMDLIGSVAQGTGVRLFSLERSDTGFVHRSHADAIPYTSGFDYYVITALNLFDRSNDGADDLLVSGIWYTHPPGVMEMGQTYALDGTGAFDLEFGISPFSGTNCFNVGDMNADGTLDKLRYDPLVGATTVELNNGDGTYTVSAVMPGCYSGAWHDVDGDGHDELLQVTGNSVIAYRTAQGTFDSSYVITSFTGQPRVEPVDVNMDGLIDLAMGWTTYGSTYRTIVEILVNDGAFPFEQRDSIYVGLPREFRFADLDADGSPDLYLHSGACAYWMKNETVPVPPPPTPPTTIGQFTLFPNPAATSVSLDLGYKPSTMVELRVFDIAGRMVRQAPILGFLATIDLVGMASGPYIVRVSEKENDLVIGTSKLFVQRP